MKQIKNQTETELTFEEIVILREIVMRRVKQEEDERSQKSKSAEEAAAGSKNGSGGASILRGWFPSWAGWYTTASSSDEIVEKKPEAEIEEEILNILSETMDDDTLLKRDVIFAKLNFHLKQATFTFSFDQDGTGGNKK